MSEPSFPGSSRFWATAVFMLALVHAAPLPAQALPGTGMPQTSWQLQVEAHHARVYENVKSFLARWGKLAEAKDSVALSALYSPRASSVAAGSGYPDAFERQAVVDQLWGLEFAGARIQVVITDFETSGELAFVATRITMNPTDYGGPQQTRSGSALFILRSDFYGKWHIRSQVVALTRPETDAQPLPGSPTN